MILARTARAWRNSVTFQSKSQQMAGKFGGQALSKDVTHRPMVNLKTTYLRLDVGENGYKEKEVSLTQVLVASQITSVVRELRLRSVVTSGIRRCKANLLDLWEQQVGLRRLPVRQAGWRQQQRTLNHNVGDSPTYSGSTVAETELGYRLGDTTRTELMRMVSSELQ